MLLVNALEAQDDGLARSGLRTHRRAGARERRTQQQDGEGESARFHACVPFESRSVCTDLSARSGHASSPSREWWCCVYIGLLSFGRDRGRLLSKMRAEGIRLRGLPAA